MKKGVTLKLRGFLPHDGNVVLGDLGLHSRQLGDTGQVRLVRGRVQRSLAERADVRRFHIDDARDRVRGWSVLEAERALPGFATGGLGVDFELLTAVRCHLTFDLTLELLYPLLLARIFFEEMFDRGGLLLNYFEQVFQSPFLGHTLSLAIPALQSYLPPRR